MTHWYNKKAGSYKGNEWVMTYGTADISAKATLAGEGSAEDVEKIFAAAIQADAPHAEGDLASTRWN